LGKNNSLNQALKSLFIYELADSSQLQNFSLGVIFGTQFVKIILWKGCCPKKLAVSHWICSGLLRANFVFQCRKKSNSSATSLNMGL